jgi:hypothetical protein
MGEPLAADENLALVPLDEHSSATRTQSCLLTSAAARQLEAIASWFTAHLKRSFRNPL